MQIYAAAVVEHIHANLQSACERVEAGFYFEEGGCFGMALALYEIFANASLAPMFVVNESFVHAMVLVQGHYVDYRGANPRPDACRFLTPSEFVDFAVEHGHTFEDLSNAKAYAVSAIELALNEPAMA